MQFAAVLLLSGLIAQASPSGPPTATFTSFVTDVLAGRVPSNISDTMRSQSDELTQVRDAFAQFGEVTDVHLVTVYRTIDLLKKHGLIDELDLLHLRGDRHYYESHGPRDHIHVACLRCGKVREFESKLYEQLKNQIARDFGMKVTVSRTEVGGYCADCLAKMPQ